LNIYLIKKRSIQRFDNERWVKNKYNAFRAIKLNYLINSFSDARLMQEKRQIMLKLKDICNSQIALRLNNLNYESKVKICLKRKAKSILKKYFRYYRENKAKSLLKVKTFNDIRLKVKIFKQLKEHTRKSKLLSNNLVITFRNTYLKYKIFRIIKKYYETCLRETYIIHRLKQIYEDKNFEYKYKAFDMIKKYYMCEKFRRVKRLQMKIKIFYILKFFLKN
jgi:hypothetical protein